MADEMRKIFSGICHAHTGVGVEIISEFLSGISPGCHAHTGVGVEIDYANRVDGGF